ncbi:MAG: hypothetical protein ABIJ52_11100 [Pseudomonadota bacterium]
MMLFGGDDYRENGNCYRIIRWACILIAAGNALAVAVHLLQLIIIDVIFPV